MLAGAADIEGLAFGCAGGEEGVISLVGALTSFGDCPSMTIGPPLCPEGPCWAPDGTGSAPPVSAEEADCAPGDPLPVLTGDVGLADEMATSPSKAGGCC